SEGRSICQLNAGEGEEVIIGHSVLFDVTHYKEIEGGRIEKFRKDIGEKIKETKKIAETNQWQQALIGMQRGAVKVVVLPGFIGYITLKK
uniref:Peptidylprolyl isomerase n=1 Tax=Parascaris univalens TaxID=6257 RepID=A0A915BPG4_PARUN